MEREETRVKRTAVSPRVDHLEEQLVFPGLLFFYLRRRSLLKLPTGLNFPSSRLYLITAESATVTHSHITTLVHLLCTELSSFSLSELTESR